MTKIQWTDVTWNPVTGCTPAAPNTGCRFCYAKVMHGRLRAMGQAKYQHDFSEVRCHPEELEKPLSWRKPRMVFVNSMSDLFHESIPDSFIDEVFKRMYHAHWHTFQLLTKRHERVRRYLRQWRGMPLNNVWGMFSASTQADLGSGIEDLRATPLAVRGLSLEPLLGPIDLAPLFGLQPGHEWEPCLCDKIAERDRPCLVCDSRKLLGKKSGIHWIIVGAESGPNRRPCHREWVLDIRDQCVAAGIPLFVKQIHDMGGKVVKMPELDGKVWQEFPR